MSNNDDLATKADLQSLLVKDDFRRLLRTITVVNIVAVIVCSLIFAAIVKWL